MEEKENDMDIEINNNIKNKIELKEYYEDKEIGLFFQTNVENKIDKIIEDLNHYYDIGDWRKCTILIKKITLCGIFRAFKKEKKKELLDTITKNLISNIYFYAMPDINTIFEFFGKNLSCIPKDYIFDWNQFYTLFYSLDLFETKNDKKNYIKFYSKLHKFIPKDVISFEDYQIMKKTILDDLVHGKQIYAFSAFIYFLPTKFLYEDDQLQMRLFYLLKNYKSNFIPCCILFSKILKKNGKLYFSKDPKENDEYIKKFIQFYFTYLNLYLVDDSKVTNNIITISRYQTKNNKTKFEKSIVEILYLLLVNENLKEYSEYIEGHLKIVINNKHLYLKEKSRDNTTRNYIAFLQIFIYRLKKGFYKKIYDETIHKKNKVLIPYAKIKYVYDRFLTILRLFSLNFEKLFLFDNEGSCNCQRELFSFLGNSNLDGEYMKKALININFENYLKMLSFFREYSETRMAKCIMKLYSIMPLLLSEYVFTNFPNVRQFIKESIIFLSENVTSANASVDIDIIIIFSYDFFRIRDLAEKNKIYEFLIPVVTEATVKIMTNLLRILDLICNKNNLEFYLFTKSMKKFLDKETQKKISSMYINFIENNEIESSNMEYYLFILNDEDLVDLFNYIYNNLLFVDSSNNIEINKHFLYPKYDKDFDINISNCSIEILIEKQLQSFLAIFSFMNFSRILTDDKMIKKFYELYYALMNQKDKKFKKLGNEFFGLVLYSFLEYDINDKKIWDDSSVPLIKYPSEKNINYIIQMYEKLILPYENFVIEYMEKNADNKNTDKQIDKQTLEQILGIYMKLIHKVSIAKTNLILNINFEEEENIDEYKIIKNQINVYRKYKNLLDNSLKVINKIFDYNANDLENKLFDNHFTGIYLDEIISLKLKSISQTIVSRHKWYNSLNKIIRRNIFIPNFKNIYRINYSHIINTRNFNWTKSLTPKDNDYYIYLKLYLLSFNSVNHPSSIISTCNWNFYSINNEKIKNLFNEIYTIFIEKLEELKKLKTDTLTEQNIMRNISESYNEFCVFYITLFPYDSLGVIEKLLKIIKILKEKKYRKIDTFVCLILSQIKVILQISKHIVLEKDKRFSKFSKKNQIIEEGMNKIYKIISENPDKQNYLIQHNNNIKQFIEKSLGLIFHFETENNNKNLNLNPVEVFLVFSLLIDYIKVSLDKKEELYRKVIQIIFNYITLQKVPVSIRVLWIQKLFILMQEEYVYYQEYEWVIFKSEEEYFETWNKLKYEKVGKESMIPFPLERIRKHIFKPDEYLNNNLKYDFDLKKLLYSMCEIDEYEEDQKLIKNASKKLSSLDEVVSKLVINKFNEKKGLDFQKAKMFYYMLNLKYIDYNTDFVQNLNFNSKDLNQIKENINNNCIIYEFLLGKYQYMLENNLFTEKDRNDLWEILNNFTRRVNKVVDERVYAFFNYIFNNYALKDLEFIFNYDFYQYPIDFVADMYFLYHQDLPNLRGETKMFINSKTEELLTRIFSTDENIILDLNYLIYVLKLHYTTNGILKYNYYYFTSIYTDKIYEHFMGILEKSDTKHRRYALFTIYIFFFDYLNNNLPLLKATLQKMALCINEFMGTDKTSRSDKGKKILQNIELSFRGFIGNINFPSLCNEIVDILIKENDINDTNKLVYLQAVNLVYKGQKHLNLFKYTSNDIFDSLFKVFSSIKNEELKKNFSAIFLTYFNDSTEEENKSFIKKYEKYIFEDTKEENEDKNKYNYIYILMNQLLRFKIRLPEYMQEFIIKLKIVNKKENNKLKKIIIDALKRAMNYYQGSYIFMKENISKECKEVLEEMTREKSYIV